MIPMYNLFEQHQEFTKAIEPMPMKVVDKQFHPLAHIFPFKVINRPPILNIGNNNYLRGRLEGYTNDNPDGVVK